MTYKEIDGDLIQLALTTNMFDVIGHGVNCFCRMKRGIAPQMDKVFGCGNGELYTLEHFTTQGDVNKLGQAQGYPFFNLGGRSKILVVYNLYTQYHWNTPNEEYKIPLDYDAVRMCFRKLNHKHKGQTIGLPKIGCGLAGGDWITVKMIMFQELKDCDVIVVNYKPDTEIKD